MKSNSVSSVFGTMNVPSVQETGTVMQAKQSFGAVLNGQSGAETETSVMNMFSKEPSVSEVQQTYEKERSEVSGREIAKAEDASEKKISTVKGNKKELEDKVKKLLSEELGISEEELENVMETLGITIDSLIAGNGLKDLMMELTGAEDMAELLLNDTFGSLITELESLIQEFSQQFGMTSEELKTALVQLEEAPEDVMVTDREEIMTASDSEETMLSTEQEEITTTAGVSEHINEQGQNEAEFSQNGQNEEHAGSQQVGFREVQTTVNAVGEQITQVVEQSFVDAEDIMRQITQFTKVTVQQTQSSIEMQLNPAHLGKIYLQVASKNGVITAQLAAENEAVKQALENQLTTLKENMNQQGLKVDAVEVIIASHEFEQNLEGNQQSAQENTQQENSRTHRFITEERLDEVSGMISEEEKIAAQIMLDNGNSMDVTA